MHRLVRPLILGFVFFALIAAPVMRSSAQDATPTIEQNKELVRSYYAAVNGRNLAALNDILAPDIVDHNPFPGQPAGAAGLEGTVTGILAAFPDWQVTNDNLIAEGDLVVAQNTVRGTQTGAFLGMPASGKPIEVGAFEIWRIKDGKLVETWREFDFYGLLVQLGVLPAPGANPPATPAA